MFCAAVVFFAGPAAARTLHIATLDLPPFGYEDEDGPGGLSWELGERIAAEAGYDSANHIVPLARGVKELEEGSVDMIIMFPSDRALQAGVIAGETIVLENVVLGRKGVRFNSLDDLVGKRIAMIRGAKYDERLGSVPDLVICETDSYPQNIRMLFAARVDGVAGPKIGLLHTAAQLGLNGNSFGPPLVLCRKTVFVLLSRRTSTPDMLSRVSEAVERLRDEGYYETLVEKYFR